MSNSQDYSAMTVLELRALARQRHVVFPAGIHKQDMIERLCAADAAQAAPAAESPAKEAIPAILPQEKPTHVESARDPKAETPEESKVEAAVPSAPAQPAGAQIYTRPRPSRPMPQRTFSQEGAPAAEESAQGSFHRPARPANTTLPQLLESSECGEARGVLEIQNDGYGFLRAIDPNQKDVYVSAAQIRRFALRNGDLVCGRTRPERENERYLAMLFISTINGLSPEESIKRPNFENLTPIYPNRRLRLENEDGKTELSIRLLDLVAPVGYGQRGLIVSPPKAGKTTLLKDIASAISINAPKAELIVLLIDERPEEVTDMIRSVKGQVYYSTFDQDSTHHITVAEQTLEKARRSVECGNDVIILMDSITRLARAANLTCTPSGRLLSGGLDPAALAMPKHFFGSARCLEEGGSLTILATALVDTGSRLDDIIYEEFKGTGNMELHLDRKLQERRVFPAIDLYRSGTRHEENLLTEDEMSTIWKVRKLLSGNPEDATELLVDMMAKTGCNTDFIAKLENWLTMMDGSKR